MTEKRNPRTKEGESGSGSGMGWTLQGVPCFHSPGRGGQYVVSLVAGQNSRPFCISGTLMVISSPSLAKEAGH